MALVFIVGRNLRNKICADEFKSQRPCWTVSWNERWSYLIWPGCLLWGLELWTIDGLSARGHHSSDPEEFELTFSPAELVQSRLLHSPPHSLRPCPLFHLHARLILWMVSSVKDFKHLKFFSFFYEVGALEQLFLFSPRHPCPAK